MGYMRHHAIVVTSYEGAGRFALQGNLLEVAHAKAKQIFGQFVSEITPPAINSYQSFFVPPDGSKEGWADSDNGDTRRNAFIEWMETQRYTDLSTSLAWVEVQYGDDNCETKICRDSDAVRRERYKEESDVQANKSRSECS